MQNKAHVQHLFGCLMVSSLNDGPVVLRPRRGWQPINFEELWRARELLYFLALRDIQVRYKQTVLGAAWAVIQPLFMMIILSVVFGRLASMPTGGVPYPLFSFCALIPWQLFSSAMSNASSSVVNEQRLISKVYFPRLVIPISSVASGLVDTLIALVVFTGMMAFYRVVPTVAIFFLPIFMLFAVAIALAIGLWLSALNVQYRDVRYTVNFMIQLWFYATPIAYPSSLVPEKWRVLYWLNPMTGVVDGFRWALLGSQPPSFPLLVVSAAVTVVLLIGGVFYFRRMEKSFADII